MDRGSIIFHLKTYQQSERNTRLCSKLRSLFLAGINHRISREHKRDARKAVRKVLGSMFVVPLRPILCLDAMLQLCRDQDDEYTKEADADLIRCIIGDAYFKRLSADQLFVETQDGVV